jgi:hypothetical protein
MSLCFLDWAQPLSLLGYALERCDRAESPRWGRLPGTQPRPRGPGSQTNTSPILSLDSALHDKGQNAIEALVGSATMLAFAAPAAKADMIVLPDPEYFESITIGNLNSNSNFYQFQGGALGCFQAPCSASVESPVCALINLTTIPDASVSASVSAYAGHLNSIEAEVAYYYEIVVPGPAQSNTHGNALIPLFVSGFASFTSSLGPTTPIGGQSFLNFVGITVAGQTPFGGTIGTARVPVLLSGPVRSRCKSAHSLMCPMRSV